MEKISKTLTTAGSYQGLRERESQGRQLGSGRQEGEIPHDHPIWDAWEQIKAYYPTSCANWEQEPPMVWYATLADLTGEQMLNGIRNLPKHEDARGLSDFPPNAGQFRDLCLTNFEWETAAHRADFTGHVQIEDLTTKDKKLEERKSMLAQLREETGI